MKDVWLEYKEKIEAIRETLDFLVPIEILVPANNTEETLEQFRQSILDICAARNNNVQLAVDTKANQAGHYDYIKGIIDPKIEKEVIWKSNEPGRIPSRDIITLSWIPLLCADLPKTANKINPVQLYSSKAKCVQGFVDIMESEDVSNQLSGKYELKNSAVSSALGLLKDLPKLYDEIYERLPEAYNQAGGKFGRISAVRMYDPKKYKEDPKGGYLRNRPTTPFYAKEVDYQCPEGFVMPLVYALSALIEVEEDGQVSWKVDPFKFIRKNLTAIVQQYKGVLDLSQWDPQRVGKSSVSYTMAKQLFEHYLLMQYHQPALV